MATMRKAYDVIVIGLGAMGSAALYQLSKRRVNVLGIEQFDIGHTFGSSHGDSRITRVAIGEGEEYVPLAGRSHEIWDEIRRDTGMKVLYRVGGLIMAVPDHGAMHDSDDFMGTTVRAAEKFGVAHAVLSTDEIRRRFPQFNLVGDEQGYYEPGAGYLRPELCIQAQLELAVENGVRYRTGEHVTHISPVRSDKVNVTTNKGEYEAGKVIVTTGSWISRFVPRRYKGLFGIYRQVLYWFNVRPDRYEDYMPGKFPIFIWEPGGGHEFLYGFPAINGPAGGVKVATEQAAVTTDPNSVDRHVSSREIEEMYETNVAGRLPGLEGKCVKAAVCLYTKTPDSRFLIDIHPDYPNIIIASPCSGHGFKHSAAIGESLAQLAVTGASTIDLNPFNFSRFSRQ